MRTHVYLTIGRLAIGQLTPEHLRATLTKVATSNLSATTVAMVRDTLATTLQRAVKDRVLPYNPVHAVDSVTRSKTNAYVLTPERARHVIRAAAGDEYEALIVLALHTGLRAGRCSACSGRTWTLTPGRLRCVSRSFGSAAKGCSHRCRRRRQAPSGNANESCGRCWIRTSDLCDVNAAL